MEAKTSFVWPDGVVVLNPVAQVYLYVTLIIDPRYLKGKYTVRFNYPLKDTGFGKFRIFVVDIFDRLENLSDGLQILSLPGCFLSSSARIVFTFITVYINGLIIRKLNVLKGDVTVSEEK